MIVIFSGCTSSNPTGSQDGQQSKDYSTEFTIVNKTSDIDVRVLLDSSSVVLEKDDCVRSKFGNLAKVQVSFKPSYIQLSWVRFCKEDSKCAFDKGGWMTLCEPGQCRIATEQHYELQGSSTEKQNWGAASQAPTGSCSSL